MTTLKDKIRDLIFDKENVYGLLHNVNDSDKEALVDDILEEINEEISTFLTKTLN